MQPKLGETITLDFITSDATGAAADADSTPTCEVFEDATDTATLSPTVVKRTSKTGNYRIPVACTTGNGFEVNKSYNVIVSATVGGVAAKAKVGPSFQVRAGSLDADVSSRLAPTVAARTLNVSAAGEGDANLSTIKTQAVTAAAGVTFPASIGTSTFSGGAVASVTAAVTISAGTGTGQLDFTAGVVKANVTQVGGSTANLGTGDVTNGTAQAGAGSTITLASGASATDSIYNGNAITLTAATGVGQTRTIVGYVGSTKVATVDRPWVTNPDATTTYSVIPADNPAVDSSLRVTAGTNADKTGYALATTPPTAAAIATAVWQDATAGDFTVASSIGKSLYTAGVVPGGSGGILISGTNSGTTTLAALTITGTTTHTGTTVHTGAVSMPAGLTANITGNLSGSVGSVTTVGDKTGYSLSVTPPTAAAIATSVWQDATAGDFTATGSIGKSLYTAGTVPGGTGGLLISGSNSGTTTFGALTVTGTTTHTGATVHTGNVSMAGGLTVAQSTANGPGLNITGNGTGSAILATGGATGDGIKAVAGAGGVDIRGNITGNLSGTVGSVTGAVGSVTGAVGSVTGNVGGTLANLAAGARTDVENAVWNSLHSTHTTAGSFGNFLDAAISGVSTGGVSAASIATAVWQDTTAGDFTVAGSPGKIVSAQLGGAFTTGSSSIFTTTSLANAPTGGSAPTTSQIAAAVWQDLTSGADFATVGSIGKLLATDIDAAISSRGTSTLTQSQVTGGAYALATDGSGNVKVSSGTGANQLSLSAGTVTVGTNADKGGYSLAVTPPTAVQVRQEMDTNSTRLANLDATVSSRLAPTVAARTLDVSATGEAGVDWANVGSPTTSLNLSGTTVSPAQAVASVAGAVGSVAGNVVGSVGSVTTVNDKAGYSLSGTQTFNVTGNVSGSVGSVTGNVGGYVVGSAASVAGAVGSVTGSVGSVTGNVGGSVATVTDKAGYNLSSTGLDAISIADPGAPAGHTTLAKMIVAVYRALWKQNRQTASSWTRHADNGTVTATSTLADDGTTQSYGSFT